MLVKLLLIMTALLLEGCGFVKPFRLPEDSNGNSRLRRAPEQVEIKDPPKSGTVNIDVPNDDGPDSSEGPNLPDKPNDGGDDVPNGSDYVEIKDPPLNGVTVDIDNPVDVPGDDPNGVSGDDIIKTPPTSPTVDIDKTDNVPIDKTEDAKTLLTENVPIDEDETEKTFATFDPNKHPQTFPPPVDRAPDPFTEAYTREPRPSTNGSKIHLADVAFTFVVLLLTILPGIQFYSL